MQVHCQAEAHVSRIFAQHAGSGHASCTILALQLCMASICDWVGWLCLSLAVCSCQEDVDDVRREVQIMHHLKVRCCWVWLQGRQHANVRLSQ